MTKNEFFATLMNNQVMPLATIDVMHEGRGMYSLFVRQNNAPNCALSRHCDGSKTGQDMHGKYLDWMHEYAVKFDDLVDAAHAEALAIDAAMSIIADDRAVAHAAALEDDRVFNIERDLRLGRPVCEETGRDLREWCGNDIEAAHAEALKENERFDNLLARFVQFKRWYPSTQRHVIEVAHADAIKENERFMRLAGRHWHFHNVYAYSTRQDMIADAHAHALALDKAYDEANAEPDATPLRWVQSCGRALRVPNCRCTMGLPVFEPVSIDLRKLYGEALRDYWIYAGEEARAALVAEHHELALAMNVQHDFYRLPLILRIVAIVSDHRLALAMDMQRDFFLMPLYQRVSAVEWWHLEALTINQRHDAMAAAMQENLEVLRQAMPSIIRMTFGLK